MPRNCLSFVVPIIFLVSFTKLKKKKKKKRRRKESEYFTDFDMSRENKSKQISHITLGRDDSFLILKTIYIYCELTANVQMCKF